ncbi:MAG: sodium:solute symporter family transporter [Gemmatimonadales bacterium]
MLQAVDWLVIASYLLLALAIGFATSRRAGSGKASYFLADRSLPWWWAGISIAATTFAADTPLVVTGIIASRGISGNWLWLSWILVHAGVVAVFARRWWRSGVITDAEYIAQRYSDPAAPYLRTMRAALYGVVYNAIIMGWVLRAMGKITTPFVAWEDWAPGMVAAASAVLPAGSPIASPSAFLTILVLVALVTAYSALGGLRGVVRTDLIQFGLGLIGSILLAVAAWEAVGGRTGLHERLTALYGDGRHEVLQLFPSSESGWLGALELGTFAVGSYLLVQGFANLPADGGGYLQQRLNATRSETDAVKAAWLFVMLQYLVRTWPWFVVGLAALVLIPVDGSTPLVSGELAAMAQADREAAYPALMLSLLPPGVLGLLVVSLLAAFMSTIDTHFNWGASYVVNDVALRIRPTLSPKRQVWVARAAVTGFAVMAVVVAVHIDTIEQAWRWVAALGAALGAPTLLRWVWWRVTAFAELAGGGVGLATAAVTAWAGVGYERQLLLIAAVSLAATVVGLLIGPRSDPAHAATFAAKVDAPGLWPGRTVGSGLASVARAAGATLLVIATVVGGLWLGHRLLLMP